MHLQGRVALVTGASSGIGLAVARQLVAAKATVAMVARGRERLEAVCQDLGASAVPFVCDVGDLAAVVELPTAVRERCGTIDVLINNAGLHHRGPMMRHEPAPLADMVTVNLIAPVVLTRVIAETMPSGGVVVNVASLAGKLGVPGSAVYSGTKAGLRMWGLAVAHELAERGIRVANVNPGPVDTGFLDEDLDNVTDLTFSQPMRTAEQVAACVMTAIADDRTGLDIDIPYVSGKLATASYLWPSLGRLLRPVLERRGAAAKRRYAASRRR